MTAREQLLDELRWGRSWSARARSTSPTGGIRSTSDIVDPDELVHLGRPATSRPC
ncbi:hypothetical protein [Geodermatophilus sp. SYSU D01105]